MSDKNQEMTAGEVRSMEWATRNHRTGHRKTICGQRSLMGKAGKRIGHRFATQNHDIDTVLDAVSQESQGMTGLTCLSGPVKDLRSGRIPLRRRIK
jgi:hypothetical protein